MPLGLFSSSSSKPQILPSQSERRESSDKDGRGTVLKLEKHVVTIEKKLAEGGFAIVYLVSDQKNRQFALKRQFVNDDALHQVEACKRECSMLSGLKGHKNIVTYVDHLLTKNKSGIYDYMLLTVYYKNSVLRLMNERVTANRFFSPVEVRSVFCDMCEAVARLHHSALPIMHRDLKVENILVDERCRGSPPIFVLCDFGSATTRVLSTETHSYAQVEEEIEKYTTLSYRAPEMIDLYSRKPIGVAADMWAMGVMLFKLCFFTLPFGESAMAIQNGSYSFPSSPSDCPAETKAIIKLLLDANLDRRPNIFQAASLAFQAASRPCPIRNVHKSPVISLDAALRVLASKGHEITPSPQREGGALGTSYSSAAVQARTETPREAESSPSLTPLVNTEDPSPSAIASTTTSVNPRLRPKPANSVAGRGSGVVRLLPTTSESPQLPRASEETRLTRHSEPHIVAPSSLVTSASNNHIAVGEEWKDAPLSCPLEATTLGFADLYIPPSDPSLNSRTTSGQEYGAAPAEAAAAVSSMTKAGQEYGAAPAEAAAVVSSLTKAGHEYGAAPAEAAAAVSSMTKAGHARTASDGGNLVKSAFRPYSESHPPEMQEDPQRDTEEEQRNPCATKPWNPFAEAPVDQSQLGRMVGEVEEERKINWEDPFGAAPFDPLPILAHQKRMEAEYRARQAADEDEESGETQREGPVIVAEEEGESDTDEQRRDSRRRFSYEHIDGVGDDASSDSKGRTDADSTDEQTRGEEEEDGEGKEGRSCTDGDDEDGGDSSQTTDAGGAIDGDDGVGSRPLLDDDELDEDYEDVSSCGDAPPTPHRLPHPSLSASTYHSSTVRSGATVCSPGVCTNPFLVMSSQSVTPTPPATTHSGVSQHPDPPAAPLLPPSSFSSLNQPLSSETGPLDPTSFYSRAPATLPRQATTLAAAPRPPPAPVASPPAPAAPVPVPAAPLSTPRAPAAPPRSFIVSAYPVNSPSSTLVSVPSRSSPRYSAASSQETGENRPRVSSLHNEKMASGGISRVKKWSSESDSPETDDSGAGMCGGGGGGHEKKTKEKKKKRLPVQDSPAMMPPPHAVSAKKTPGKRPSSSKRGSQGALNASFINVSFQSEDFDRL